MDVSAHACNLSTQEAEKGSSKFKAYYGGQYWTAKTFGFSHMENKPLPSLWRL